MARRPVVASAAELAQIGLRHQRAGDAAQAERSYLAALTRNPKHLPALSLLGTLLVDREPQRAADLLQKACELAPDAGPLWCNLGEAQRRLGRPEQARLAFEQAVQNSPELAEAHYNLALLLEQFGELGAAAEAYQAALELRPELGSAACALLGVWREAAEYDRALTWYENARGRLNDSAELRCAIAAVLSDVYRIDEAVAHLQQALELEATFAPAHAELAAALLERGEGEQAVAAMSRAVALAPAEPRYASELAYLVQFSDASDPSRIDRAARDFAEHHAQHLARPAAYENARDTERRLRIGYVSADFRFHPVARFLLPLLRHHDREHFEVFCYSSGRREDATTEQYRACVAGFHDISGASDEEAARLIVSHEIDILVDLMLHSAGNRLLLFARKPAPVQFSWLAYPGTTGLPSIDYRLTDGVLEPPELGEGDSAEVPLRLPHAYWCYEPASDAPPVASLPALREGRFTFGSLNSFKKASDASLELWSRVLEAVPGSRLLLIAPEGAARQRVLRALSARDLSPERVELVAPVSQQQYLELYGRIDLALDPVTYGGGTTSLDAYWMGVPVLTLPGKTRVSRAGATLATQLQLDELIATSPSDFIERASGWSRRLDELALLRSGLRERLEASPLMDHRAFARGVEAAYQVGWRRWSADRRDPPDSRAEGAPRPAN